MVEGRMMEVGTGGRVMGGQRKGRVCQRRGTRSTVSVRNVGVQLPPAHCGDGYAAMESGREWARKTGNAAVHPAAIAPTRGAWTNPRRVAPHHRRPVGLVEARLRPNAGRLQRRAALLCPPPMSTAPRATSVPMPSTASPPPTPRSALAAERAIPFVSSSACYSCSSGGRAPVWPRLLLPPPLTACPSRSRERLTLHPASPPFTPRPRLPSQHNRRPQPALTPSPRPPPHVRLPPAPQPRGPASELYQPPCAVETPDSDGHPAPTPSSSLLTPPHPLLRHRTEHHAPLARPRRRVSPSGCGCWASDCGAAVMC